MPLATVQPPYKIGGDYIVVGGHREQTLDRHIRRELPARRRRRLKRPSGQDAAC